MRNRHQNRSCLPEKGVLKGQTEWSIRRPRINKEKQGHGDVITCRPALRVRRRRGNVWKGVGTGGGGGGPGGGDPVGEGKGLHLVVPKLQGASCQSF